MSDDIQRCLDAGMDAYLSKPVDIDELRRVRSGWLAPTRRMPDG